MVPTSTRHYLDHAATTPWRPVAREAFLAAAQLANPSSLHHGGRMARAVVEDAREAIAAVLELPPRRLIFTGGATEADNLAIVGLYLERHASDSRRCRILTPATEHKAVLESAAAMAATRGALVETIPVRRDGVIDPDTFRALLAADPGSIALATAMWVNNETGVVQPIGELAAACAEYGVPFHSDAVQALAYLELGGVSLDTLALSAHKVGGPMGVGALVVPADRDLPPLSYGGGQELGIRSGTVNAAGIAAFAAAVIEAARDRAKAAARVGALRDRLEREVLTTIADAVVTSAGAERSPAISHIWFPDASADALLMSLDQRGLDVSTGSACTVGIPQPSHVVLAQGCSREHATESLRFSLGWCSTDDDITALIAALPDAVRRTRSTLTGRRRRDAGQRRASRQREAEPAR